MRTLSLVWLLLLLPASVTLGQSGKIAGKITDAETGEGLPGANIVIRQTGQGTASDTDGNYFILNVRPGTYEVTASMVGYAAVNKTEVNVRLDQTTTVDFVLRIQTIEGEEITVVAERPAVEVDLTASKETVTSAQIEALAVQDISDALKTQSGVSVRGAVRGTFGNDIVYYVDGMEMRDPGSNANFSDINLSAIEQMEVLTGGYNAEYGRASGAIINIVTKSSWDRFGGSVRVSMRPEGKYHWGRDIYSQENYEWAVMGTRAYWDPATTYTDWDGTVKKGNTGGPYFQDKTPDERLAAWKNFIGGNINDRLNVHDLLYNYDQRTQWETEGTIYGPIARNLSFMLSGRYLRGVSVMPSMLKYQPSYNFQGKLAYRLSKSTSLQLNALYGGYENAGFSRSNYNTTEDNQFGGTHESGFFNAYDGLKYWPFGTPHTSIRAPEYKRTYSGQLRLTHTFGNRTFAEFALSHMKVNDREDNLDIMPFTWDESDQLGVSRLVPQNSFFNPLSEEVNQGDLRRREATNYDTQFRADLTSQITDQHQVKAGFLFSYQNIEYIQQWGWRRHLQSNYVYATDPEVYLPGTSYSPYEGAAYVQDKYEAEGLVINAGLRLDYFSLNKKVSDTIWDPLRIMPWTPGNRGANLVSMGDEQYLVKPSMKWALSPRIGISHPITETSVLHFMYGHFVQRPSWKMMGNNPSVYAQWKGSDGQFTFPDELKPFATWYPQDAGVGYAIWDTGQNPNLTYERVIQYEVGYDQSIADLLRMDVTLYYKDGKGLVSVGQRVAGSTLNFGTDAGRMTTDFAPDPFRPTSGAGTAAGTYGIMAVPSNGGYLDSRGLEISLETARWRNVHLRTIYNLSFTYTNRYGLSRVYIDPKTLSSSLPEKVYQDTYYGASNSDRGISGNTNDRWNPHNTLKLIGTFHTPGRFGPAVGRFRPLGNWSLNWFTTWASGILYTYHAPSDLSTEPNNKRWEPRWETNIRLTKGFRPVGGLETEFTLDVYNLFNQRQLRPLGGTQLQEYEELGLLPRHGQTKETLEWTLYEFDLLPRQVYFGFRMLF